MKWWMLFKFFCSHGSLHGWIYAHFQKFFKIFLAVDFDVCHSLQNVNVCGDVAICDALFLLVDALVFIEFFVS